MGEVNRLMHYFSVPKGEYIRILYNGTSSGIKSSPWAPPFALLTVRSTLWAVERGNFMVDRDMGEMFINFMLREEVRSFCGVDITNVRIEEDWESHMSGGWEKWEMNIMGLIDLPYHTCQAVTWDKCIVMGYQLDSNNIFAWGELVMNLPWTKEYDCKRP